MRPISITMSAFGSYAGVTQIDFEIAGHGIFLITGDTGAGKTTIFDGISFALYGETSGGARDGSMMRSQYAGEAEETYVELCFSDRGGRYVVRRSPSYQRISRRRNKNGEKTVITSVPSLSLIMPDGSEYPGRINEIGRKVEEIIGVDRRQFSQIAMIAQGEYLKLLHATSRERKEIFSRIFDTGVYGRIQQKLKERNDLITEKLQNNRKLYDHEAGKILPAPGILKERWETLSLKPETGAEELLELLPAIALESREQEERARRELEEVQNRLSGRIRELENLTEKNRRLAEKEKAALRLAGLKDRGPQQEERRKRLLLSSMSEPAVLAERTWSEKKSEAGSSAIQLKNANAELAGLQTALAEAEWDAAGNEALLKKEGDRLAVGILKILDSMKDYGGLEQKRREYEAAEAHWICCKEEKEKAGKELDLCENRISSLRKEQDRLSEAGKNLAFCTEEAGKIGRRKEAWEIFTALLRSLKTLEGEWAEKKGEVICCQEAYGQASGAFDHAYRAFIEVQAGIIASELSKGCPCPVCGSTEHPRKAVLRAGDITEAKVEAAKRVRDATERRLRDAAVLSQKSQAHMEAVKEQAQEAAKRLASGNSGAGMSGPEDLAMQIMEALKTDNHDPEQWLELSLGEENKCAEEYDRIMQSLLFCQNQAREAGQIRQDLTELEEQCAGLKTILSEKNRLLTESAMLHQKAALELSREKQQLPFECAQEAEMERKRLEQQKSALSEAHLASLKTAGACRTKVSEISGYIRSMGEKLTELCRQEEILKAQYEETLKKQGFDTEESYRSALMDQGEKEELEKQAALYDRELLEASTILKQYEKLTKDDTWGDTDQIQNEADLLTLRKQVLSEESVKLMSERAINEAACASLQKLLKDRRGIWEEKQLTEPLYLTADGKLNRFARIDFQTYVQRRYFRQMIAAANRRLLKMTDGRFLLQCRELETLGRQGEVGLDLDVYSMATDRTRDVKTLSGGESFMAALSMALGMADLVQNTAGRVNIDAMFIDEGFGSLDEEARTKAMRVLQELAGDRRLIGIISHVTEMKEQIDKKLIVEKSDRGSKVRWELEG